LYHGPGKFNPAEGIKPSVAGKTTYTQVFGQWLCDMAQHDKRLVGITPAMREGSGMVEFEQRFPDRYYDVGITEQHAVTFAGGMGAAVGADLATIPLGKGEVRRSGKRVAILAFGTMLAPALKAAEELNATVANMRFVKPLDAALVLELAAGHDLLVTVEEGCI